MISTEADSGIDRGFGVVEAVLGVHDNADNDRLSFNHFKGQAGAVRVVAETDTPSATFYNVGGNGNIAVHSLSQTDRQGTCLGGGEFVIHTLGVPFLAEGR